MKFKLLFAVLFALLFCTEAKTQYEYESAIGLRAAWGIAATGKFFINDAHAVEGILQYRGYDIGSFNYYWLIIRGLYEVHNPLAEVTEGLQWYYGGGAYVGFYGGDWDDFPGSDLDGTFIGISGVIGLDYKFEDIPLNLSLDWIPSFNLVGGGDGFLGESGGIAIRYVLK